MNSNYELLKSKEILAILDGDTIIEEIDESNKIKMPYLSGPQLCELSQKFGCYQEYYWGTKQSNLPIFSIISETFCSISFDISNGGIYLSIKITSFYYLYYTIL